MLLPLATLAGAEMFSVALPAADTACDSMVIASRQVAAAVMIVFLIIVVISFH